jgi:hypothetical protein
MKNVQHRVNVRPETIGCLVAEVDRWLFPETK